MVKNFSETIKVPASFLVDLKDLPEESKKRLILFASMKDGEEKTKEEPAIIELLPDKVKTELAEIGLKLPTEMIDLTVKLGDTLYNLYNFNVQPVCKAPMPIARHQKILLDLAELFAKDEFEVPDHFKEAVKHVLDDEKAWANSKFGASVMVNGVQKYIGLTAVGVGVFNKILNAVVEIFLEDERKSAKTE